MNKNQLVDVPVVNSLETQQCFEGDLLYEFDLVVVLNGVYSEGVRVSCVFVSNVGS